MSSTYVLGDLRAATLRPPVANVVRRWPCPANAP